MPEKIFLFILITLCFFHSEVTCLYWILEKYLHLDLLLDVCRGISICPSCPVVALSYFYVLIFLTVFWVISQDFFSISPVLSSALSNLVFNWSTEFLMSMTIFSYIEFIIGLFACLPIYVSFYFCFIVFIIFNGCYFFLLSFLSLSILSVL